MEIQSDKIQNIIKHLGDDESRCIFENRLLYSLSDDCNYLSNIVKLLAESAELHDILCNFGKDIVILGGVYYSNIIATVYNDLSIVAFCDDDFDEQSAPCSCRYKVIKLHELIENYKNTVILVTPKWQEKDIIIDLISRGINENNIVGLSMFLSKLIEKQYFDLPQLDFNKINTFVDGGCFNGADTINLINKTNGTIKKIWAFEPDKDMISVCYHNLKNTEKNTDESYEKAQFGMSDSIKNFYLSNKEVYSNLITLYNIALWNEKTLLYFEIENRTGGSHIILDNNSNQLIEADSLDNMLGDMSISFIKMDIEGAELNALRGAENIIKSQSPILAICVYHKPEDIWEIPNFILELNSNYTFYLRHYSFCHLETVLYAIPNN